VIAALMALLLAPATPAAEWSAPQAHRLLLDVEGGTRRGAGVASVEIDFAAELAARGAQGTFDEATVEIVGYDAQDHPRVFDEADATRDRYLVPWRLDHAYGTTKATLRFVLADRGVRRYAVHFDTRESGLGRPRRHPGMVGDGDLFPCPYGRRALAANAHDAWGDLDGDGDLDLLTGGTEPYLEVYENAGRGRLVPRGRLTSGGEPLVFPADGGHRSWLFPALADGDGDGDADLFVSFLAGPYINRVVRYENTAGRGGPPTYVDRGPMATPSGQPIVGLIGVLDWDGDGTLDLLGFSNGVVHLYRNLAAAEGEPLVANGVTIQVEATSADAADLDADGDLDLVLGTEEGRVYLFENEGTRTAPVLTVGRLLFFFEYMDAKAGVKVADFDGDGLLDVAVGRYWERTRYADQPRVFGRLFENVGTATAPRFAARDAGDGAPHLEGFLPCDAVRQNGVRAFDWDRDGRPDLVVGDTDGFVWLFRNTTGGLRPVFSAGEKIEAAGEPIKVYGETKEARLAGYARIDVADWNGDGRHDLVVADGRAWVWVFLDEGKGPRPELGRGRRLSSKAGPISGTGRGSVLVTDWDGDGRRDLIFAMVGEAKPDAVHWPPLHRDPQADRGFLYYRNVGTPTAPVLAVPKWIKAGPETAVIDLARPNLGSFVDWDGDGKRDFIACEFENNCRVWRRTDAALPGMKPQFGGKVEGEVVLAPRTHEMISGVDALDWDGDGEIDLLTGQGHGGSGIRYYRRGYLEDVRSGTLPKVTIRR
jgi:hypothetical protein